MIDVQEIRKSLIQQLRDKNADLAFLREEVESYCKFASIEDEMWRDIQKNGKTIELQSCTGKVTQRENPAWKMLVMASKQKLDILKKLGLDADSVVVRVVDEDTDI